jgi:pimeloyl-ACP methyl ester carboxylesterase
LDRRENLSASTVGLAIGCAMRDFLVSRGSTTIHGSETGVGSHVLLLHAGVADRRSWFDVMAELEGDAHCVAYDQRGHGETAYDTEPYAPVDDLLAVLDDLTIERSVLVGNSRGGQIAIEAALRVPDRVAALLIIGSAPTGAPFAPPPAELVALQHEVEAAERAGDLPRVNELEARIWLDGPLAPSGRVTTPARDLFLAMNGTALHAPPTGACAPFSPAWDRLAALEIPVSVVVGSHDVPVFAAAEATAGHIVHSTFRVLEGMAHLPMLEAPSVVADEIRGLLARVAG